MFLTVKQWIWRKRRDVGRFGLLLVTARLPIGVAAAKEDLHIAAGEIKAYRWGTANHHQRTQPRNRPDPVHSIRIRRMDTEPDWGLRPTGWRVRVHGDAPLDLSMPFPVPLEERASVVPAVNANGLVNAIQYVCASPPGILTTEELPHILARGPHSADRPRSYACG